MPRFRSSRRRHRFRQGGGFMSDRVPTDYTFDRLTAKLAEFRASPDRLRLISAPGPALSHWARALEKEHTRAVQVQRAMERQRAQAAAVRAKELGQLPPPFLAEEEVARKPVPPEGTFAGARQPGLRSRLLVLDASFNPPTRAHAHMAKAAVHDVLEEQRAAVAEAEAEAERHATEATSTTGATSQQQQQQQQPPEPVVRPETRLVLLLAVANADKPAQPAPLEHRLAMIYAFARHLQEDLRQQGDGVPVDMALTSEPFFSGKADALRTASWYPHMRPGMTFRGCDAYGRALSSDSNSELPPMEFIVGFDTLVRILDPKYYKEEDDDDRGGGVAATAASQNDDDEDATAGSGHGDKGKERMTAEAPSEAAARKRPQTPMMRTLDPFFAHASLRVLLRPGEDHGGRDAQRSYLAALGGAQGTATPIGACSSSSSLDELGGDASWMRKVHVVSDNEDAGSDNTASASASASEGVSSSRVRQRVYNRGAPGAQDLVYPLVLDWIKAHELYRRPRPPKGTFTDDGGLVEITSFGDWRKEDFCD